MPSLFSPSYTVTAQPWTGPLSNGKIRTPSKYKPGTFFYRARKKALPNPVLHPVRFGRRERVIARLPVVVCLPILSNVVAI